ANEKDRESVARDERRSDDGNSPSKKMQAAPAAPPQVIGSASPEAREHSQKSSSSPSSQLSDEYAATGMGRQTRFGVTRVDLELEPEPAAVVRLRYEFRPQLIALGVLPRDPDPSRVARREHARGFEEFCPEVR
ncbi:MAG TPA: hypothetical protein VHQ44_10120, partial [Thermoanaerobaculia bacterium]|nr:hypothetical protein [Thermoanaerobaculia bacterium]